MPNADRAAVAREVLTEFKAFVVGRKMLFDDCEIDEYMDTHYPAPPAPVTVTVNGVEWQRTSGNRWKRADTERWPIVTDTFDAYDRIAADARRIAELEKERDDMSQRHTEVCQKWSDENLRRVQLTERIAAQEARIAELETQLQRALDGAVFHEKRAHHAEQERDAARARIAELEQLLQDQPRLLYDSMWQAIDRMGDAVGTLTGPGSNCHVTATRVCETIETLESERDAALRALEEAKGAIGAALAELTSRKNDKHRAQYAYDALAPFEGKGLGKINGAEQAPAEEPSPATVDAAPAPIPPGADEKPFDQTMDAKLWAQEFVRRFPAHDEGLMLAWFANAIMRGYDTARAKYDHPVATRETVERVVTILRKQAWSSVPFTHRAEEILTAAGFTLEAGA